ncbi:hypothetical protein [Thiolapillus sp.]|uniref:hypothetical protein n=1 Tax=Thiolapillus sp. TaxID=2017437 RepID=UPI003AF55437
MFSLWRKARRENSAASRLLGSTSLRFALHGWQRKCLPSATAHLPVPPDCLRSMRIEDPADRPQCLLPKDFLKARQRTPGDFQRAAPYKWNPQRYCCQRY